MSCQVQRNALRSEVRRFWPCTEPTSCCRNTLASDRTRVFFLPLCRGERAGDQSENTQKRYPREGAVAEHCSRLERLVVARCSRSSCLQMVAVAPLCLRSIAHSSLSFAQLLPEGTSPKTEKPNPPCSPKRRRVAKSTRRGDRSPWAGYFSGRRLCPVLTPGWRPFTSGSQTSAPAPWSPRAGSSRRLTASSASTWRM